MFLMILEGPNLSGGSRRAETGDIIDIVPMRKYIGKKERGQYLWIPVTARPDFDVRDPVEGLHKRRYSIKISTLKQLITLDENRMQDMNDHYQPAIEFDDNTGRFVLDRSPIDLTGIIWDKVETRFV